MTVHSDPITVFSDPDLFCAQDVKKEAEEAFDFIVWANQEIKNQRSYIAQLREWRDEAREKVEAQRKRADEAEENLRDRLAAKAMEIMLQDDDVSLSVAMTPISIRAYRLADAMMAARSGDLHLGGVEMEVGEDDDD